MKKIILPVAIVLFATSAAFATKIANDSPQVVVDGYRLGGVGEPACVITPKDCETVNTGKACQWNDGTTTHNLRRLNGSSCGSMLFEITPN